MPLTEDELRAIEARAEAATPGEWRVRKGEGLWWTVEVELPSINGLRCWYTIARFDFDMAANGYTDGALRPEADATLLANARQDIPRLAAALREAWAKHGEYWHRADRAEKAADEYHERMCAALHPPCSVCGNEERHSGTGALTCECPDPSVTRALAAEADCKRLQDEVAALDAARREAEAELAGERGEYQRHSQGHMDRALAAEAAAAAMREALGYVLPMAKGYAATSPVGNNHDIVAQAECTYASPTPGAALLAERDRLREALSGLLDACQAVNEGNGTQMVDPHAEAAARAVLKEETSNG